MLRILKTLFFIFLIIQAKSQSEADFKIPKQMSFEIGYRNIISAKRIEGYSSNGAGALFDYAWKLKGFDGNKNGVYLSVPIGYSYLPKQETTGYNLSMLNYGWTVRHEFGKKRKLIPFLSYSLFLNHVFRSDKEGSVIGHQTQFDFGYDIKTNKKMRYFAKLTYSYSSYPEFDEPEKIILHFCDFRVGVRF